MTLAVPGAEPSTLRHQLRAATAPLHEKVDAYMGRLLEQEDGGYARFLSKMAEAILPLEQALDAANVAAIVPDWEQRSRSAALRSDLAMLSVAARTVHDAPQLHDEATQFGVLYVLEGSRLGSRVIVRELQAKTPFVDKAAMRFLSHGAGLPLWQTFLQQLEASQESNRCPERVIAGACAAFALFLPSCSKAPNVDAQGNGPVAP